MAEQKLRPDPEIFAAAENRTLTLPDGARSQGADWVLAHLSNQSIATRVMPGTDDENVRAFAIARVARFYCQDMIKRGRRDDEIGLPAVCTPATCESHF